MVCSLLGAGVPAAQFKLAFEGLLGSWLGSCLWLHLTGACVLTLGVLGFYVYHQGGVLFLLCACGNVCGWGYNM